MFALISQGLLCATGGKAFAAQYWSSARGLEGHAVSLAALVAGDLEALALAAPAPSASTKVGAAAVAASLATLRLTQISFRVVFLFAFGEWKRRAALGAGDFYVWHFSFSLTESHARSTAFPLSSKGLALAVFQCEGILTVIERRRSISSRSQKWVPSPEPLSNAEFTSRLRLCTESSYSLANSRT